MEESHIIKNGGKRIRHGSYRSVYLDSPEKGYKMWRGEYQSVRSDGVVRLRKWFRNREDAERWVGQIK